MFSIQRPYRFPLKSPRINDLTARTFKSQAFRNISLLSGNLLCFGYLGYVCSTVYWVYKDIQSQKKIALENHDK